MLAEVSVDEALDAPAKDDPAYAKWYYKRCYGVEPDETIEEYKQWAKALMEAAVVKGLILLVSVFLSGGSLVFCYVMAAFCLLIDCE